MDVTKLTTQIQQEIVLLMEVLSGLTGLASRWNAEVELAQDARASGRKPFTCRIVLNEHLANDPVRWRTLIHEALHSFGKKGSLNKRSGCSVLLFWKGWEFR